METVVGDMLPSDPNARLMPPDTSFPMSIAIASVETAASRANEWGRFWMAQGDHAHGRRWFFHEKSLRMLSAGMRQQQFDMLHPPEYGTPTRRGH